MFWTITVCEFEEWTLQKVEGVMKKCHFFRRSYTFYTKWARTTSSFWLLLLLLFPGFYFPKTVTGDFDSLCTISKQKHNLILIYLVDVLQRPVGRWSYCSLEHDFDWLRYASRQVWRDSTLFAGCFFRTIFLKLRAKDTYAIEIANLEAMYDMHFFTELYELLHKSGSLLLVTEMWV